MEYYITSPFIQEEYIDVTVNNFADLTAWFSPEWEILPCQNPSIPKATHELNIIFPYVRGFSDKDLRLKYVCKSVIIICYGGDPNLHERLYDLTYLSCLSFAFQFQHFAKTKGLRNADIEFLQVLTSEYFPWKQMAFLIQANSQ